MKNLLIVEDEKLIRQGIKSMVQRSGVPIEVIMECGNGEMALEILKTQEIDVMFTDIRMPKMDGVQLVKEVSRLEKKPLIVAVSGYDDFSYAVEMLRNGVREYILKPVEREKIAEVLKRLDEEIEARNSRTMTEHQIGMQQIKHILRQRTVPMDELALLRQQYEQHFFEAGFIICMAPPQIDIDNRESVMVLEDICDGLVCVIEAGNLELFERNELTGCMAGISSVCHGIDELQRAYSEAAAARELAFCVERTIHYPQDMQMNIPEGLRRQAEKMLEEQSKMQRLQLIGTDKTEELTGNWEHFFMEVEKGRILPRDFFSAMEEFLAEVPKIYRNVLADEDQNSLCKCEHFLNFNDLREYQEYLMNWLLALHSRINEQADSGKNMQKIKLAVEYINQNYSRDLNMAVVSNYISMNYSLFSYSFKQYTGSNFVNYLKEIRIREAKRLLKDTDMKIIEISRSVGYDNEKNFMKVFKAACGVSPTEYRRNVTREVRA